MRCKHCASENGCGRELELHNEDGCSPSCMYPPLHCGNCPPWICDDCHETTDSKNLRRCWISLEGMPLADIKAVFAASDIDLSPPQPGEPLEPGAGL